MQSRRASEETVRMAIFEDREKGFAREGPPLAWVRGPVRNMRVLRITFWLNGAGMGEPDG